MLLGSSLSHKPQFEASSKLMLHLIADLPTASEVRPYLERIDATRWYTNFGPLVQEFEDQLLSLLRCCDQTPNSGAIHLTTLSTCYYALEIGLKLLGVKQGDNVLMPAVTFPACPHAALNIGASPLLADIDQESFALTPTIARKVAAKTHVSAVMPVALYGIPLATEGWDAFTRDTGIPVIIDAAAAFETQEIPKRGLVAHSMHATKPFGIGEGGLLVSRENDLIEKARRFSNFGMVDRLSQMDGANAKMSEYHAAVGLAQVSRWPAIKALRKILFETYREFLPALGTDASFHRGIDRAVVSLLMVRWLPSWGDDLVGRAKKLGIALHQTYLPPLYRHPYFAHSSLADCEGNLLSPALSGAQNGERMVGSERMTREVIGIPFHPFLNDNDVSRLFSVLPGLLKGG